jgi:hypothetical protein
VPAPIGAAFAVDRTISGRMKLARLLLVKRIGVEIRLPEGIRGAKTCFARSKSRENGFEGV